ncbi:hypothetical protein HIM_04505 [Hirsutella minnesotensis 3608]|uniref:DUF7137 domain-containing protein n=1 Tax=Hirsutella minnesotensis 3608 TaxID=1043627 RepID=A0A0F8A5W7_9HYPO|nr:hypothetical protein HIM_04505 [Hirsutella minnesotensis 3608]
MRVAQSLVSLAVCLAPLVAPAASLAWPDWHHQARALAPRADASSAGSTSSNSNSASAGATPSSAPSSASAASTRGSGESASTTLTDLNTAEPTDASNTSGGRNKSDSGPVTRTPFDNGLPPGGVNILTPAPLAEPTPLYKIRDNITWSWNYTSLEGTPTAVDVLVSCSTATKTWTLTTNMTFETSVNYVWDTKKQADSVENPLLNALYTLIVKDSDTSITSAPEPGYLAPWSGFKFGLYTGKTPVPFKDWKCVGCSDAASLLNRQALGLAVTMSLISFFSFTWFVVGLGLN